MSNNLLAQDSLTSSGQLQSIIKEKNSRNKVEQKMSSGLLQAVREFKGDKQHHTGLEPANVNADAEGNLKVDIKATVSDQLLNKIKTLGGIVIFSSKQYNAIRAQVNLNMVEKITALPDIKFIEPAVMANLNRTVIKPIP